MDIKGIKGIYSYPNTHGKEIYSYNKEYIEKTFIIIHGGRIYALSALSALLKYLEHHYRQASAEILVDYI